MRTFSLLCLALATGSAMSAQTASNSLPELPKDPRGMLAAAAPLYDFNDSALRPWHLKGTYQLYDESGKPGEQGNYEYWWVAPDVFRSSWTRPGASRTEWHTADGKIVYEATGQRLFYFEHRLESLLFSPIPATADLDPSDIAVANDKLKVARLELPCAVVMNRKRPDGSPVSPEVVHYCFDTSAPVLRIERESPSLYIAFNKLVMVQKRVLARQVIIADGKHDLVTFTFGATDNLAKDDTALTPPAGARPFVPTDHLTFPSAKQAPSLAKKTWPHYPAAAKAERIQGTVTLDVMISVKGEVRDVRVISSPAPLLTGAARDSLTQWQYKPYIVDGQPQEVNTLINVIFQLE
jgi:TonB family protein